MEGLKYDPYFLGAKACKPIFVERAQVSASDDDTARCRAFQASCYHQERGLSRAARTNNCHSLAQRDV
jgi:hypothetical protein